MVIGHFPLVFLLRRLESVATTGASGDSFQISLRIGIEE